MTRADLHQSALAFWRTTSNRTLAEILGACTAAAAAGKFELVVERVVEETEARGIQQVITTDWGLGCQVGFDDRERVYVLTISWRDAAPQVVELRVTPGGGVPS